MKQTENTAIVLRHANYRDNDRMLTLLSPSRGRLDVMLRNCRKPKSQFLNAGELFALGDYLLYESAGGHLTVTSVNLIETFYPLRSDYDRLTCGIYLLNLAEAAAEPEQEQQELFMLLLHTLSRLTFSDQEWKPLLAGFLLHFSACQGFKPRLNHCVFCGRRIEDGVSAAFDISEGGLVCPDCASDRGTVLLSGFSPTGPAAARQPYRTNCPPGTAPGTAPGTRQMLSAAQVRWMRQALTVGSASWINTPEAYAPFSVLRPYVESRLGRRIKSSLLLPKD